MIRIREMKLAGLAAGMLLMAAFFAGCGPAGADKDTVAVVNGESIALEVLDKNFLLIERTYKQIYGDTIMTEQIDGKSVRSIVLAETLDNLIDDALITQKLEKDGFKASEEEVEKRYADFTANELEKNPDSKAFYETNGIGKEFIENAIRSQIYVNEFTQRLHDDVLLKSTDLDARFKEYVVEVRARHILVESEGDAQALLERLKKGEDFAALAKAESIDPGSATKGGDLGFFKRGAMVKEFDTVAFSLKPGDTSEPVKTQFGYHIIQVTEQKTVQGMLDEGVSEEELKAEREAMVKGIIDARIASEKKALRDQAAIEKYEDKLK